MPLNSKTNLKLIDAVCEGPIEGLVQYRKGVYLNETQVSFDQLNVERSVLIREKVGTKTQTRFEESSLLRDAQTTIESVNTQIGSNYSEELTEENLVKNNGRNYGEGQVIREISDTEVDFIKLVFTIPKLYCVAPEGLARGQLFTARIKLEISIQDQGGAFKRINIESDAVTDKNVIEGISTSEYQFDTQQINLEGFKAPYKIKVRKLKFVDPEDAFEIKYTDLEELPEETPLQDKRADTIFWTSIILGKTIKTNYPYTAVYHLSIDSEEYDTLPARAYEIKGKKVRIPSNASVRDDGSLIFDDDVPFDGRLKTGLFYTTCPVCCFYDMLVSKRYGCGDFVEFTNLSWVDLIELSKYCNALVDTPEGPEPRFAINTVIGSQAEAYGVLQDMASVFRGMLFWKADTVQVAADHGELNPTEDVPAIHVFSNSNVVNGSFSYSGSSLKTRSTRVRVRYNDPENFYKANFIVVEDQALVAKYGVQEKDVVAFGCTSKYQAQRMGRWIMKSEKFHDETVTFSVGMEGLNVLPGQVFEVSDEMRLGLRLAGRIVGAQRGFVKLDQTATLPSGTNNKITVVMADGTIETKDIQSVSGTRVNIVGLFSQAPPDDALYAIRNDSAILAKYRCISVGENENGVYSIVGVKHVDGIYRVVEDPDAKLELPPPFFYGEKPAAPQDLKIRFQQIDEGRNTKTRATVSWTRGLTGPVVKFRVNWKVGSGNNWERVFTTNNSITIDDNLIAGEILYVRVRAIGPEPDRKVSDFVNAQREISVFTGDDTTQDTEAIVLPPNPQNVQIEVLGEDQVILRWGAVASGQNLENFVAYIKHSSKTDGTGNWANSVLLRKVAAQTTYAVLPLLNGEYLVKFKNIKNQSSLNAGSAVINIPESLPRFNFEIIREDLSPGEFPGHKNNVYYSDLYDGLVFSGDASFDAISNLDNFSSDIDDHFGNQFSEGEYIFYKTVDLGAKYSVVLTRLLSVRSLYKSDLIDDRTALIDSWTDFDGEIPDGTDVELYFRKSDSFSTTSVLVNEDGDGILFEDSSAPRQESDLAFEEWIPLENNVYVGRSFQFKAVLKTERDDQTPLVDQLGVSLKFNRRTENSTTIQSGTSTAGKAVTFDNAFYTDADTKVTVGITAFDLTSGDFYEMSEPTRTGFTITFKASDGRVINKAFQYTAVGYGTEQP